MPTNLKDHRPIHARSPFFINCEPTTGSITEAVLTLNVQRGSRNNSVSSMTDLASYTLTKTNAINNTIVFDIAPLIRDWFEHNYNANIRMIQFEESTNANMSYQPNPVSQQGRYVTILKDTTEFCDVEVGDLFWLKTPAFSDCFTSWIESVWLVELIEVTSTYYKFDVGDTNKAKMKCLIDTIVSLPYAAKVTLKTNAEEQEIVFVKVRKQITDGGAGSDTTTYYTAAYAYANYRDGVNFLPTTGATGDYGNPDWTPAEPLGTDVTIMATNCYRQMGENSYVVLPIFSGEFDDANPNLETFARIKWGGGDTWLTDSQPDTNTYLHKLVTSDFAIDEVEYAVTYIGLGKKNLCDQWIEGQPYLRVAHMVSADAFGVITAGTSNDMAVVNDNQVLRYEIICEPKYDVIDCLFINKFGYWDSFSFLKKSIEQFDVTDSFYNTLVGDVVDGAYTYNVNDRQKVRFNTNGMKSMTVNTGFVNESFSLLLQEIMMSEAIYLIINDEFYPVNINTKSVQLLKSVNDKNINYQMSFEFAYNEIQSAI